jgi:hypothetical protein
MREEILIKKLQNGDASALDELISMYYQEILRYCIWHAPDRTQAEELCKQSGNDDESPEQDQHQLHGFLRGSADECVKADASQYQDGEDQHGPNMRPLPSRVNPSGAEAHLVGFAKRAMHRKTPLNLKEP